MRCWAAGSPTSPLIWPEPGGGAGEERGTGLGRRAGQLVIDVSVAPVLMLETQRRRGWGGERFTVKPLYVLGAGVAGEVISVGEGLDPDCVGRSESFAAVVGRVRCPRRGSRLLMAERRLM